MSEEPSTHDLIPEGLKKLLESPDELERMDVDTDWMVQSVVQEYDSPVEALAINIVQNAWDARLDSRGRVGNKGEGPWPDWKLEIRYRPGQRILEVEDYGTSGIERWAEYRSIGFRTKKLSSDLGGWAEGSKSLAAIGGMVYTESLLRTGERHWDIWIKGKRAKNAPLQNLLNHTGTITRVFQIVDEIESMPVHSLLGNIEYMKELLQHRWDGIIRDNNANITYECGDRKERIEPIDWPKATVTLQNADVVVKSKAKEYGRLKEVLLGISESEAPSGLQGIQIRVYGQTVDVYTPNHLLGPSLSRKLFGWCVADFLGSSKRRGHVGFRAHDWPWAETKRLLDTYTKRIRDQYQAKEGQQEFRAVSDRLLKAINSCIEAVPELNPGGLGRIERPKPDPKLPEVRVLVERDDYKPGDHVRANVIVMNRTHGANSKSFPKLAVEVIVYDANAMELSSQTIGSLGLELKGRKNFDYAYILNKQAVNGEYTMMARLKGPLEEYYDISLAHFWVGPRPPPKEKEGPRKASADETKEKPKGRQTQGLRKILVGTIKPPVGEPKPEGVFDVEQLVLYVNKDVESYMLAERINPKTLNLHIARAAGNELMKYKLQRDIEDLVATAESIDDAVNTMKSKIEYVSLLSAKFMAAFASHQLRSNPIEQKVVSLSR